MSVIWFKKNRIKIIVAILALICGALSSNYASAQASDGASQKIVLQGDGAAAATIKILVINGKYIEALELLNSSPSLLQTSEGLRLKVQLMMELGMDDDVIILLEKHLAIHPDDALARFQIGELHYRNKRDKEAKLAYRMALSGNLDALRVEMANKRLAAINRRRAVKYTTTIAIIPDSNYNSATNEKYIDIFGLPFSLDDDARKKSGVSLGLNGAAEFVKRINNGTSLNFSGNYDYTDAPGHNTDLLRLDAYSGIEFSNDGEYLFSIGPEYWQSWIAGKIYEKSTGIKVSFDKFIKRTDWRLDYMGYYRKDLFSDYRSGWYNNFSITRTKYSNNSSFHFYSVAFGNNNTDADSENYNQYGISLGKLFNTPLNTTTLTQISYNERRFDAASFAYGVARNDKGTELNMKISKRDWLWFGSHPYISLNFSNSESNINLYKYNRQRVEFGLTREF